MEIGLLLFYYIAVETAGELKLSIETGEGVMHD